MDGQSLVAEFGSAAVAARMAKELAAFLEKVAVEFDKVAAAAGKWPEKPTPTALAFGRKYGVRWEEPITWGSDRLAGHEPEVGTLGPALALFHDYMPGGFGAELPALLKKAGAKVRMAERPPLVYGEVPISSTTRALVKKLTTWFEQRLTGKELDEWTRPPWSRRSLGFGQASDAAFLLDDGACTFILPLQPSDFEPLRAALGKVGATVRVATSSDEKALSKRELTAAGSSPKATSKKPKTKAKADEGRDAKAKPSAPKVREEAPRGELSTKKEAPPAIPSKAPTVEHLAGKWQSALFSTGTTLYGWNGAEIISGRDATTLTKLAKLGATANVTSVFVDDAELWAAGNRLWRSTNGGKSFTKLTMPPTVDPDFWGKEFHGVAKDASGVVWVGGTWVVTIRRGQVVHEKGFGADARIKAVVPTPFGVLLLTFNGLAFLANDGKAERLRLRGKGHLSAACVTPRGTLIVVGCGAKWSAEIYRSEDGGATFKPVRVAKLAPLQAVAVLPDGRLVAGGRTLLLVSTDDGKKWKPVTVPSQPVITFDVLCRHGDAIVGNELRLR